VVCAAWFSGQLSRFAGKCFMSYLSHSDEDRKILLDAIGVTSVDELLTAIPEELRLHKRLDLPPAISEVELRREFGDMAKDNDTGFVNFMGGGASEHYIPAALDSLASRSEFVTAYTPYQAEVSQGTLQVIYEFQSMMCELTGMEAANASLYEGGSALAEAAILAAGATRRLKIVVSKSVNPRYREVLKTTTRGAGFTIEEVAVKDGVTDVEQLIRAVDDDTAAVMFAQPNFLGYLEPVDDIVAIAKANKALATVSVDPISLSLLSPPGDYGVDIVTGEGQPLGIPLSYGGPYLGFFAVSRAYVRRMPGRIAGAALDTEGRRGYVLTLQTREQHIRREKATSNICTNQALCALRATIYLALLGKEGFRKLGELCVQKSHYLADEIVRCQVGTPDSTTKGQVRAADSTAKGQVGAPDGTSASIIQGGASGGTVVSLVSGQPFFREFAVKTSRPGAQVAAKLRDEGFLVGPVLDDLDIDTGPGVLLSVTELRTKAQMDALADAFSRALA
jgi:glycine dehydrogenase subunit 1